MIFRIALCILILLGSASASADVWKWVDAAGNTHYVNTMKPIYTWVDEFGKVHYSDTPDHEDAVQVEFVWHSGDTLEELKAQAQDPALVEGTDEYYCKRAIENYESYINAPQLYITGDDGERIILSQEEVSDTIATTRKKIREYCGPDSQVVAELGIAD